MPIVPDTKDWTWVLTRPCPECGLDLSGVAPGDVAALMAANAEEWRAVLAEDEEHVRTRPSDDVWSPLEYACHVRDVHRVFDARFQRALAEDDPLFENWDQDATAVAADYASSDPATVAAELADAAGRLVGTLSEVEGADWERPCRRSDGASFTVASLALYLAHDPVHHLVDVRRSEAAR
jgi:hypothetical protein